MVLLSALGGGAVAATARAAGRGLRRTRHRLAWPGPGPIRVVQLSDLHLGWRTSDRLLQEAVDLCCLARPDLVVLTGDYVSYSRRKARALRDLVDQLPRPCVATLGNHDHWCGAERISRALQRSGVLVLSNAHAVVNVAGQRLTVVGLDDGFSKHADVERAFAGVEAPQEALVLSHDPNTADAIAAAGAQLILSGHTHGGQVAVPRLTPAVSRLVGNRYLRGWYRVGGAWLYVNTGVGASWRVGRGAAPEVALFELSRAHGGADGEQEV